MSIMPARGGIVTILSSGRGTGVSNRLLPVASCPAPDDQNQDEKRHKGIADDDHRTTRPPGRPHGTGCSRDIIRLQGRTRAARRDAFGLHAGSTTSVGPAITGCRSPSRASGRQLLTAFASGARGPAALEQMVSLADGNPSGTDKIFSRDVLMSQAAGPVHHPG